MKLGKIGKYVKPTLQYLKNTKMGQKLYKAYQKDPKKFGKIVGGTGTAIIIGGTFAIIDAKKKQAEMAQIHQDLDDLKEKYAQLAAQNNAKSEVKSENPTKEKPAKAITYQSPKIGENGIAAADTAYWAGNYYNQDRKPASITYYGDKAKTKPVVEEQYTEQGALDRIKHYFSSEAKGKQDEVTYNPYGEQIENLTYHANGTCEHQWKDNDGWNTVICDKYDRELETNYSGKYGRHTYYTYKTNGNKTEEERDYKNRTTSFVEKDKNDRIVKQKHFDSNAILKYTVYPKYDSEGAIIKNDTIYNN